MRAMVMAVLLGVVSGCGPELASLEQARSTWAREGLTSYRYTYDPVASGGPVLTPADKHQVVTVRNGLVAEGAPTSYEGTWGLDWTVEGLLLRAQRALSSPCETSATFDTRLGYPRRVEMSCTGDRGGWVLSDFQAL